MSNRKSVAVNTRFLIQNRLEGIGYFTNECLKWIVNNHPEIDFYFLFDREYSNEFIFADNIKPVILFPPARHPFLWLWWFEYSVAKWLNKNQPDLFLSPDGYACLRTNVPQVIVMHDLAFEHFDEHVPFLALNYYRLFMPRFAKKAARIATVSQFSKNDIIQQYNITPELIDVVYSAAKEGYRTVNDNVKEKTKETYAGGKNYFLYVGSIHPRKNIPRLLQAFDTFKEETLSDFKLIIVGKKGWDYEELDETLIKMKHSKDVMFPGYMQIQDLLLLTASAYCMIFVSLFEGFGVPIIEAMSSDVPVITSNVTSMPEIGAEAAILVNPFSTHDIFLAMKEITSNHILYNSLIAKGRIQAKKFNWEQTSELLWDCCLKILQTK
jgi:glycosyltransferase involved in cell wall biosynthesis